jgi:hypothetical protein
MDNLTRKVDAGSSLPCVAGGDVGPLQREIVAKPRTLRPYWTD